MISGILLILAFLHFFPQYSVKTEWSKVLLKENVRDTLNTLDRMNKTFEFATDPGKNSTKFDDFMETLFLPRLKNVTMIWWKEVNNLTWGESMIIPYFTEGYMESMVDVDNVVFHDNFNDGNDDGWTADSEWIADNWEYGGVGGVGQGIKTKAPLNLQDLTIEANFKIISGTGWIGYKIRSYGEGKDQGYVIQLESDGDIKLKNETFETSASTSINVNEFNTIKTILNGNTIRIYVNDELKINFAEVNVVTGEVYLHIVDAEGYFDDITVRGNEYQVYSFTLGLGYPY